MDANSLINEQMIDLDMNVSTQEEAIHHLATLLEKQDRVESKVEFKEGVLKRESEFSTGFGNGFAIPHCKSVTVKKASILIGKTNNEIEWNSMDGKPVRFIIMLAIPAAEGNNTHLQILSALSGELMDDDFRSQLLNADKPSEILELLEQVFINKTI